jgi:hypothetical protein
MTANLAPSKFSTPANAKPSSNKWCFFNPTTPVIPSEAKDLNACHSRVSGNPVLPLFGHGQAEDIQKYISALKDRNVNVRLTAVKALGAIKDQRSVGPLISALKDKDNGMTKDK